MKKLLLALLLLGGLFVSVPQAEANTTITVKTAFDPNAFGSPSYLGGWQPNANEALRTGQSVVGSPGPTQFSFTGPTI